MKYYVTLIDQFGSYRLVVNGFYRVVKSRIGLEVLNVFDGSGR